MMIPQTRQSLSHTVCSTSRVPNLGGCDVGSQALAGFLSALNASRRRKNCAWRNARVSGVFKHPGWIGRRLLSKRLHIFGRCLRVVGREPSNGQTHGAFKRARTLGRAVTPCSGAVEPQRCSGTGEGTKMVELGAPGVAVHVQSPIGLRPIGASVGPSPPHLPARTPG